MTRDVKWRMEEKENGMMEGGKVGRSLPFCVPPRTFARDLDGARLTIPAPLRWVAGSAPKQKRSPHPADLRQFSVPHHCRKGDADAHARLEAPSPPYLIHPCEDDPYCGLARRAGHRKGRSWR